LLLRGWENYRKNLPNDLQCNNNFAFFKRNDFYLTTVES
jgi:hypothetical protein